MAVLRRGDDDAVGRCDRRLVALHRFRIAVFVDEVVIVHRDIVQQPHLDIVVRRREFGDRMQC